MSFGFFGMIATALLVDSWLALSFYWRDLVIAASAFSGLLLALFIGRIYLQFSTCQQRFNPVILTPPAAKHPHEKIQ